MPVPDVVKEVYDLGLTPIPQRRNKAGSPFRWTRFRLKKNRPDWQQIIDWNRQWPNCFWAVITGQPGGLLVLDFDGPEGVETLHELGLKPHIKTQSGGYHVWIRAPRQKIQGGSRVDEAFPMMDLKADGMVATIFGSVGRKKYTRLRNRELYEVEDLPEDLQNLLVERRKASQERTTTPPPKDWEQTLGGEYVNKAMTKVFAGEGRNDTGLWLACQLRDDRYPQDVAQQFMQRYMTRVNEDLPRDDPYTPQEAYNTTVSAYSQPARDPWLKRNGPVVRSMNDITPESIVWLWHNRIPQGMLSGLEGDPDKGKSLVTVDLAARVSRGASMPDGTKGKKGSVLMVSAEDSIKYTIRPRLDAARFGKDMVYFIELETDEHDNVIPMDFPDSIGRLRQAIEQASKQSGFTCRLVVIDPITAYLGEKVNYNNDAQVRKVLYPLAQVAEETGAAFLLVRHLNKGGQMKALYRGGGSIAFSAAFRSSMVCDVNPMGEGFVLARVKNNIAPRNLQSLTYSIVSRSSAGGAETPVLEWGDGISMDADTLLSGGDQRRKAPELDEAIDFLREIMERNKGRIPMRMADKEGKKAGLTQGTMRRAINALGLQRVRVYGQTSPNGHKKGVLRWDLVMPVNFETGEIMYDFGVRRNEHER